MINRQAITHHITIGGRPDAKEIAALHAEGFSTIVNLLMPDEDGALEEEHLVKQVGMDYAHVPISPDTLDDLTVARFSEAVSSSEGPVAVHCKGGGRAGIMTLIHLAIEGGWSLEETLKIGEEMGAKIGIDSPYRDFLEDYILRHSAGERG